MVTEQFSEKLKRGVCVGCGKFSHPDVETMSKTELEAERKRLMDMTPLQAIGEFGNQQGDQAKLICLHNEYKRRKKMSKKCVKCNSLNVKIYRNENGTIHNVICLDCGHDEPYFSVTKKGKEILKQLLEDTLQQTINDECSAVK